MTITLYSRVLRSTYRCRSYSEIGAYIHGGKRKAFATGATHVVHSLICSVNRDTFLFHSPPELCQKARESSSVLKR